MDRVPRGYVLPSAAFTIQPKRIHAHIPWTATPRHGDVLYGRIERLGAHRELENKSGRIHRIADGSAAIFVVGNRYASDAYEAVVPTRPAPSLDLVARSGMVGEVKTRNSRFGDPTRVRILGQVVDKEGEPLNTLDHSLISPASEAKRMPRSKLILVVGTSMNSGKSTAAVACCWALTTMGHEVRASKVTGTASLKDILHMNDAGAKVYNDFTYLGHPSTYLLPEDDLLAVFNDLDLRYANNPRNYWVVELADGVLQRETSLLLSHPDVRERIHRLIFCASDTFGALGGLTVLRDDYQLTPAAISGLVSGSPLGIRELAERTDIPVFDSAEPDLKALAHLLL
ncbi:MAG: hypothetical protein ISR43_02555 [Acidimicrobiia bacterium]|nr:hypothetical protein [Actinomycetota bacterium]MBL6924287.1 hypothetical protein [Acidimicrobiia bacterium]MBL6926096.1 hypothetical protein [Acidimicrobiia bacterium]